MPRKGAWVGLSEPKPQRGKQTGTNKRIKSEIAKKEKRSTHGGAADGMRIQYSTWPPAAGLRYQFLLALLAVSVLGLGAGHSDVTGDRKSTRLNSSHL